MRKILLIGLAAAAVLILAVAAVLLYAALNLNSIIKNRREYLLARMSDSLGRQVQAQDIHVGLGWGVTLEVSDLQVADDPAFSQLPFVKAKKVSGQVELLPLLGREILLTRLVLQEPAFRVLRDNAGHLNASSIGSKKPQGGEAPKAAEERKGGGPPINFLIQSFTIKDGKVLYQDGSTGGHPVRIERVNLDLNDVSLVRPISVKLGLAALGGNRNLEVDGSLGPLMGAGGIQVMDAPISLSITAGPILLDRLRSVAVLGPKIPPKLSMPDPVTMEVKVKGTPRALDFDVNTDLTATRLVYLGVFNKPAGTTLKISAAGLRRQTTIGISQARIKLADLDAALSEVKFGGGAWSAKVDTNRFDLPSLTKMAASLAKYSLSGNSEAHLAVSSAATMPQARGTIALGNVGFKPEGSKLPGITNLTGTVRLNGNAATLEPTSFDLGSGHATLQGQAQSLRPLSTTYSFKADGFKLVEFLPTRPPDEEVKQLTANGSATMRPDGIAASTLLRSGSGMVGNVPYRNLSLNATYDGRRVNLSSLTLNAYGGSIGARADASLPPPRPFRATTNLANVDLEQALRAQKAKAADTVRGLLTGQVNVSGKGANIEEIKPTLGGNGRIAISKGKLIGVNVASTALRKIRGIPVIDTLFTPSIVARHPALFNDPDTDLKQARLSFVLTGPRITSHDITVESTDYRILGDGWFDMDKNIDMSAHLLMSRQFSSELQAEKKNVVYLMNQNNEIDIPLIIRGALPKPSIQPDVQYLAQRAATRAAQEQGSKLLNRFLGKKGGSFFGGGGTPSGNPPPSSNPLNPLKKLFP